MTAKAPNPTLKIIVQGPTSTRQDLHRHQAAIALLLSLQQQKQKLGC
jgi:hypothetical protein